MHTLPSNSFRTSPLPPQHLGLRQNMFRNALCMLVVCLVGGCAGRPPMSGEAFRDCTACPEMVSIPAGTFQMGADLQSTTTIAEMPKHPVTIGHPFAIGRYEVTVGEFDAFVAESGYVAGTSCWTPMPANFPRPKKQNDWREPGFPQTDRHPVGCVLWSDAIAYVDWLKKKTGKKYRLPTEAEWEYAARAGTTTSNYWGDSSDNACNYANVLDQSFVALGPLAEDDKWARVHRCNDTAPFSSPVGSYLPNAFGLYDTAGNQWELVQDCWHDNYQGAPRDGSAWKAVRECVTHVARGTSWINQDYGIRSARSTQRYTVRAKLRAAFIGFRVARD